MSSSRLFLFALFCIGSVISKKVCDFEDDKCLTRTAGLTFVEFISGIPGVESSEPLHQDLIDANLPTITYKLNDANLSGMKNCAVELVKINSKDLKYNYHVGCPHLTLEAGYEMKGDIGPQFVEGKGTCKVDLYDYHFLFNGDYENKEGKEGKMHIQLKNHVLELEAKGKVHYEFQNLYNGDKEKSDVMHKFANENWQVMDKETRQPTMKAFMKKYIYNVNAYLAIVPVQELFSE